MFPFKLILIGKNKNVKHKIIVVIHIRYLPTFKSDQNLKGIPFSLIGRYTRFSKISVLSNFAYGHILYFVKLGNTYIHCNCNNYACGKSMKTKINGTEGLNLHFGNLPNFSRFCWRASKLLENEIVFL